MATASAPGCRNVNMLCLFAVLISVGTTTGFCVAFFVCAAAAIGAAPATLGLSLLALIECYQLAFVCFASLAITILIVAKCPICTG
jgi:hypothetical protein